MQNIARSLVAKVFNLLFVATILTAFLSQAAHAIYISPDDWDPTKQGVGTNRYAYSQGDPVNKSDRNGHQSDDEIGIGHNGGPDIKIDPDDFDLDFTSNDPLSGYALHSFENKMKSVEHLLQGFAGDVMIANEKIAQGKITGFGQQTGKDTWHADASYKKAMEYAKDPNVASVHLNRSLDAVLGKDGISKARPDITVVYKDGTTVRVCECVSATQKKADMDKKADRLKSDLEKSGYKGKTDVTERGDKSDPTGGNATGEAPKRK